jgi:NTE family protein
MNRQNSNKDVIIAKLVGLKQKININFYYVPTHLTDNPLIFDPEQMSQWWKDGYEFAKTKIPENICQNPTANENS